MEEDVAGDLSGDLRSLMVGLINAGRDESEEIDAEKVQQDAKVGVTPLIANRSTICDLCLLHYLANYFFKRRIC